MKPASIVTGFAAALASSTTVLSSAMLLGATGKVSQWVIAAGFAATFVAVWLLPSSASRFFEIVGAALALALALALAVPDGIGPIGWSLIVGAPLAAFLIWVRPDWSPKWRTARATMLAALAIAAFVITPLTLDGGTLGHDESAYALKARSWIDDTPTTGWSLHRGIGMSIYATPLLEAGGNEASLRLIGLIATLGLAWGVWALGGRVANERVGAIAAVSIVAGPAILRRGTEYLSDIPSAALLMAVVLIVWLEFETREDGPTFRLLWSVPLALVAFYLRYQSLLSLGLIAATALILWWPKIRRRPGPVVGAVVAGLLGLVPHALFAVAQTGSPWGILLRTGVGAVRDYLGQGLVDYGHQLLWPLAGFVGPIAAILFVVAAVDAFWHHEGRSRFLFLATPAVLQVVALGIVSHGEPRFIFFPLALILIVSATAVDSLSRTQSDRLRPAVGAALALTLLGSLGLSAAWARDSVALRSESNLPIQVASEAIAGEDCAALTSYVPQVTYYSRCSTRAFEQGMSPENHISDLVASSKYMIIVDGGKNQPSGTELDQLVDSSAGPPIELPRATVYVFPGT